MCVKFLLKSHTDMRRWFSTQWLKGYSYFEYYSLLTFKIKLLPEILTIILNFCLFVVFLAGNSVEVDESLFQDMDDLELDEDDPDFDPLDLGSDDDD